MQITSTYDGQLIVKLTDDSIEIRLGDTFIHVYPDGDVNFSDGTIINANKPETTTVREAARITNSVVDHPRL